MEEELQQEHQNTEGGELSQDQNDEDQKVFTFKGYDYTYEGEWEEAMLYNKDDVCVGFVDETKTDGVDWVDEWNTDTHVLAET